MSRKEDFKKAADDYVNGEPDGAQKIVGQVGFEFGAEYGYKYAQTHPNWISVEDKLPEENQNVIAYNGVFNEIHLCDFHDGIFEDFYGPFDGTITHWMQLPQAPRKV